MTEHAYRASTLSSRSRGARTARPGAGGALGLAGGCLVALALLWAVAEHAPAARLRDAILLHDFTLLSRPGIDGVASFLLHLLDPLEFVLWGIALIAVALARERPRVAVAVAVVMACAPLTSEILKPLLAHPHIAFGVSRIGSASWPSGHSTAALALVLSAVLVAPPRLRALTAWIGGAYALAVGCALLILAWHMPSDVLGGYLVATCWAALALAAVRASERRWPARRPA
jgi:membrane-associated phospholipid phosphatase